MPKLKILAISGLPGSGKTTICNYLQKKHGYVRVHGGDYVWNYLKKKNWKMDVDLGMMLSMYFWVLDEDRAITYYTLRQIEKQRKQGKTKFIVDGLRVFENLKILKKKYSKTKFIVLVCDQKTRFNRELKRRRFGERPKKIHVLTRDKVEKLIGFNELVNHADYFIDASQSLPKIYKEIKRILRKL